MPRCIGSCWPSKTAVSDCNEGAQESPVNKADVKPTKGGKSWAARSLDSMKLKTTRDLFKVGPGSLIRNASRTPASKECATPQPSWPHEAELKLCWCVTQAKNSMTVDDRVAWLNAAHSVFFSPSMEKTNQENELKRLVIGVLNTPEAWKPCDLLKWIQLVQHTKRNTKQQAVHVSLQISFDEVHDEEVLVNRLAQQAIADLLIALCTERESSLLTDTNTLRREQKFRSGWKKVREGEACDYQTWALVLEAALEALQQLLKDRQASPIGVLGTSTKLDMCEETIGGDDLDAVSRHCLFHCLLSFLDDDDSAIREHFLLETRRQLPSPLVAQYNAMYIMSRLLSVEARSTDECVEVIDIVASKLLEMDDNRDTVLLATNIVRHELSLCPELSSSMTQSAPEVWPRLLLAAGRHAECEPIQENLECMLRILFQDVKQRRERGFYDPCLMNEIRKIAESKEWHDFADRRGWRSEYEKAHPNIQMSRFEALWRDVTDATDRNDNVCLSSVVICPQCDSHCDLQKSEASPAAIEHSSEQIPIPSNSPSQTSQGTPSQGTPSQVTPQQAQSPQSPSKLSSKKRKRRRNKRKPSTTSTSTCPDKGGEETVAPPQGTETTETLLTQSEPNIPTGSITTSLGSVVVKEVWQCVHCNAVFDREVLQLPQISMPSPSLADVTRKDSADDATPMMPNTPSKKVYFPIDTYIFNKLRGLRRKGSPRKLRDRIKTGLKHHSSPAVCDQSGTDDTPSSRFQDAIEAQTEQCACIPIPDEAVVDESVIDTPGVVVDAEDLEGGLPLCQTGEEDKLLFETEQIASPPSLTESIPVQDTLILDCDRCKMALDQLDEVPPPPPTPPPSSDKADDTPTYERCGLTPP
eukprot:Blabericola_migrator_1__1363@NODE_1353_length_4737_cov_37_807923_g908_i0_p1_GENE_NODE_1353_length_4737_cov_37_807923_g908_i0NODE_1353_length_4737_cov_37_807923_g908_i0_p1_ORF_typecomplete_len867_score188_81zinc_ribbon_10/PF10058_9/5_4zinc_ribbon_10/PF10058_9/1_4e02_NODE_1353_length_4737_cov_37_807923_g908_i019994599